MKNYKINYQPKGIYLKRGLFTELTCEDIKKAKEYFAHHYPLAEIKSIKLKK